LSTFENNNRPSLLEGNHEEAMPKDNLYTTHKILH
jgi:hypothetical protein